MPLISVNDFRAAAQEGGAAPDGTVFRFSTSEQQSVVDADRTWKNIIFSDETLDHAGDVIAAAGWDTVNFNKNPVALFAHMSSEPPIGRAKNVLVRNNKLVGDIEFASADIYPFADTIYRLVRGGFLKAVSVGFKPLKWKLSTDPSRPYGIDFQRQMLLEISVCPVPCNPNALGRARSNGIDTSPLKEWAERALDSGVKGSMPRRDLEALRSQASNREARIAHAVSVKRALAASSPAPLSREERIAEAAALRRSIEQEPIDRATRLAEVEAIRRSITPLSKILEEPAAPRIIDDVPVRPKAGGGLFR